jgi:hypothetical protein
MHPPHAGCVLPHPTTATPHAAARIPSKLLRNLRSIRKTLDLMALGLCTMRAASCQRLVR